MVSVTVPTDEVCDIILASNAFPTLSLAYQELGNEGAPTNTFSRAAQTTVVQIAGRSTPVGFRPGVEGKADVFDLTLIVAMDTSSTPVADDDAGRVRFDPIVTLVESGSYVAVIDGRGNRRYCFAEWQSGSYDWNLQTHLATIRFTECAEVPTPVVTASTTTP